MLQMRRATPENRADVVKLWQEGFGDEEAFIDEFCAWCGWEQILLLWEDGEPCAMTAAPLMEVTMPGGGKVKAGYIYAHTTLKEHRGRGFGKMLLNYADFCLQNQNADCAVLVPAEESLFDYFACSGYRKAFYHVEEEVKPAGKKEVRKFYMLVGEEDYQAIREELLKEIPHVVNPLPMLGQYFGEKEETYLGLYSLEIGEKKGCFALEYEKGKKAVLHELLIPGEELETAIAFIFECTEVPSGRLRRPLYPGETGGKPFGAVKWYRPELAEEWKKGRNAYFGLVLD